jgi:hypothetical protein
MQQVEIEVSSAGMNYHPERLVLFEDDIVAENVLAPLHQA